MRGERDYSKDTHSMGIVKQSTVDNVTNHSEYTPK